VSVVVAGIEYEVFFKGKFLQYHYHIFSGAQIDSSFLFDWAS
jgi:hypothetical protein